MRAFWSCVRKHGFSIALEIRSIFDIHRMFVTEHPSVKTDMCGRRLNSSDRKEPKVGKEKQSVFSMLRSAQATTLDCSTLQSVEAKNASLRMFRIWCRLDHSIRHCKILRSAERFAMNEFYIIFITNSLSQVEMSMMGVGCWVVLNDGRTQH